MQEGPEATAGPGCRPGDVWGRQRAGGRRGPPAAAADSRRRARPGAPGLSRRPGDVHDQRQPGASTASAGRCQGSLELSCCRCGDVRGPEGDAGQGQFARNRLQHGPGCRRGDELGGGGGAAWASRRCRGEPPGASAGAQVGSLCDVAAYGCEVTQRGVARKTAYHLRVKSFPLQRFIISQM